MALGVPSGGNGGEDDGLESVGGIFADINITPLTDIFLVLLIIFMVTTTAIAESGKNEGGFEVNLPRGGKTDEGGLVNDLTVAVLADGRAVVSGRVVDDADLRKAFSSAHGHGSTPTVLFQADEGVPHGRVVQLMEMARREGLSRLAIATHVDTSE